LKSRLASEYCFGQGLENGTMTNSCAILLGILIRDLHGVQIWDGNNLNLGSPIGSGSCLG